MSDPHTAQERVGGRPGEDKTSQLHAPADVDELVRRATAGDTKACEELDRLGVVLDTIEPSPQAITTPDPRDEQVLDELQAESDEIEDQDLADREAEYAPAQSARCAVTA